MLYHLFKYFDNVHNLPGAGMFQYISFRAAAAIIIALLIVIVFGRNIINFLRRKQIGEEIRDLGLEGQLQKKGTPTMGGVIILLAILIPVLLFGQLDNVYIQLMLVSTIWLGLIGFLDDYIKVFRHHKEGLKGRFKIVGQVGLGIIVGTTMCFSPDIVVREKTTEPVETIYLDEHGRTIADHIQRRIVSSESRQTTQTTIPFVKDNEFDYSWLTGGNRTLTWILYVVVAILVVTAVSNGANLTDGLDGLVTGVSAPIVLVLGILAYLSGHIVYADYLNIMYIPGSGELVVFAAALAGALVGFLWYNSFPAQIFMGDTGSLTIGMMLCFLSLKLTMCGLDDNTGNVHPMVLAFSPLLVPCCDVVRVYLHRVRNGKNPFLPDKNHIHHKLLALGIKQRNTMIIIVSVSTIFILLNILLSLYLNVNWIVLGDILIWTLANIRLTKSIAQLQSEQKTNK